MVEIRTPNTLCGHERTVTPIQYFLKNARDKYFSDLITAHQHIPKLLFKTVDQLLNPAPLCFPSESNTDCEKFLSYFNDKVESIRASVIPNTIHFNDDHLPRESILTEFPLMAIGPIRNYISYETVF